MPRMIFVNLPVHDLAKATAFYQAIGATLNPTFSDDTASCMVFSETIYTMLLTHAKWAQFTTKPIADTTKTTEVMLALTCDSRDDVGTMLTAAAGAGGKADVNPAQDYGFMLNRSFADPDGHVWEAVWMDPAGMAAAG
ncbi:MAG: VOC family protein [Paracoccaceae bacterium]|mgnify:FL=1